MMIKPDLSIIKQYTDMGTALIGVYDSGAVIAKGDDLKQAYTADLAQIKSLAEGRGDSAGRAEGSCIKIFRFVPKNSGFLVIDIDRHGKKDGLKELRRFLFSQGLTVIQNYLINPNLFPCFVKTPNNGYHLYFKIDVRTEYELAADIESVDILYTRGANAAGSVKDEKRYSLHGGLKDAVHIEKYPALLRALQKKAEPKKDFEKGQGRRTHYTPRTAPNASTERLMKNLFDKNYSGKIHEGNRHTECLKFCNAVVLNARKDGLNVSAGEIKNFIETYADNWQQHDDADINRCIADAIRKYYV